MRAVVKISNRQYQVEEGRYLLVDRVNLDKLGKKEGDTLEFGDVLMVLDGDNTLLGAPLVKDAKVKAKWLGDLRDKKVLVYKMRPKKGYRLKHGHRQELTRLQIEFIEFPGRTAPQVKPAERKARPEKKAAEPAKEKAAKKQTTKAATVTETEAPKADKAAEAKADKPAAKKSSAKKAEGGEKKASAKKPAAKKTTKKED